MIKTDIVEKLITSSLAKKWTILPFIVETVDALKQRTPTAYMT
jgi:hypothetical protein